MPAQKLSALSAVSGPLQLTDAFYLLRGGLSRKITGAEMFLDNLSTVAGANTVRRDLKTRFDEIYNIKDFGAIGDGVSRPLNAGEAAAFNALYGAYGATGANSIVAGDERDWAAIQCCLWKAANTGVPVFMPAGTFVTNKPLILSWTSTPITGQPQVPLVTKIHGAGVSTIIYAKNIATGRGAIEFLGESNPRAVNCELSYFTVEQDASCHRYSWCARLGDAWCGLAVHRCIFRGANGIRLKVASSVSYANLCTLINQCQVWTNWQSRWHASETTADVYALAPESGGSYWDNVKIFNSIFQGQVDVRAFVLNFDSCQFFTPSNRPGGFNYNVVCQLGSISFSSCYFEDHYVAIATVADIAPIASVRIIDCHFSGVNNNPPGFPHRAIQCAPGAHQHGPVTIENCRFGPGYTYCHIDLYGTMSAAVLRCSCPWVSPINTGPVIIRNGNVRLVVWSPNGVLSEDTVEYTSVRVKVGTLVGPTDTLADTNASTENADRNTNAGNAASQARVVEANGVIAKLAAFSPAHASLANQVWLFSAGAWPLILGYNGTEVLRVIDEPRWQNTFKLGGLFYAQTATKSYDTSNADVSLFQSGSGSLDIPANTMRVGRKIVVEAGGHLSTTGTPTITFKVFLGGVQMAVSAAIPTSTFSNVGWSLKMEYTIRSLGVGGTVIGHGTVTVNGLNYPLVMTAPLAFNSTISRAVDVTSAFSVANVGNAMNCVDFSARVE